MPSGGTPVRPKGRERLDGPRDGPGPLRHAGPAWPDGEAGGLDCGSALELKFKCGGRAGHAASLREAALPGLALAPAGPCAEGFQGILQGHAQKAA
jgi:hypothetical protein